MFRHLKLFQCSWKSPVSLSVSVGCCGNKNWTKFNTNNFVERPKIASVKPPTPPQSPALTVSAENWDRPRKIKESSLNPQKRRKKPQSIQNFYLYYEDGITMYGKKSRRELHVFGCHRHATQAVVLTANEHAYFFNCPEGLQRSLQSMQVGLLKKSNILITQNTWTHIGGLIGLSMTLQGQGRDPVSCHGSNALNEVLSNARGFSQFDTQPDVILRSEKMYIDQYIKITYVPLNNPAVKKVPKALSNSLYNHEVTSYILENRPAPPRIDMEKCVQLGIKKGPAVGQLKNGEEVTLPDGTVIKPEQVLREVEPVDPPLLVIDCPSIGFFESLKENKNIQQLFNDTGEKKVSVIVHMTPEEVVQTDEYMEWMKRFGPDTEHLMVNSLGQSSPIPDASIQQAQMNLIDAEIFPLNHHPFMKTEEQQLDIINFFKSKDINVTLGQSGLKYSWQKAQFFRDNVTGILNHEEIQEEALEDAEFASKVKELKPHIEELRSKDKSKYPQITFLGTASAAPNKCRNVSGIFLQSMENQNFLLDCGEGSLFQLYTHFGAEKTRDLLVNLDMIFISHLHPDHHLGFFNIILERERAFRERSIPYKPVTVITSQFFENWYKMVERSFGVHVRQLIRHELVENFQVNFYDRCDESVFEDLSLSMMRSVHVHHTQFPFGIRLQHVDGWSLVYSGDTMPCEALVREGHNCDVLIHEATFVEGMESDAKLKNHSTLPQALKIGADMKAKFTLLTHFSQRFHKAPIFPPEGTTNAGSAMDHMQISLKELEFLPLLKPCIEQFFHEEITKYMRKVNTLISQKIHEPPKKKYKKKVL